MRPDLSNEAGIFGLQHAHPTCGLSSAGMTRLTAPILCVTAWSALSVGPQGPSVKNAAELRAQRPAEVERARFFDADGTPLAQMGELVKITPGGEPLMV